MRTAQVFDLRGLFFYRLAKPPSVPRGGRDESLEGKHATNIRLLRVLRMSLRMLLEPQCASNIHVIGVQRS